MNDSRLGTSVIVRLVDAAWSVVDDFTPSRSLKEIAAYLNEVRRTRFDQQPNAHAVRLEAHASALQRALAVVAQHNEPGTASTLDTSFVDDLQTRLRFVTDLLHPESPNRDTFGGTASGKAGSQQTTFRPLATHGSVTDAVGDAGRRVSTRLFGTIEAQRAESAREARVHERLRALDSMADHLADAAVMSGEASAAATHRLLNQRIERERQAATYARQAIEGWTPPRPRPAAASTARTEPTAPGRPLIEGRRRVPLD